jgi:hypothetical protein
MRKSADAARYMHIPDWGPGFLAKYDSIAIGVLILLGVGAAVSLRRKLPTRYSGRLTAQLPTAMIGRKRAAMSARVVAKPDDKWNYKPLIIFGRL